MYFAPGSHFATKKRHGYVCIEFGYSYWDFFQGDFWICFFFGGHGRPLCFLLLASVTSVGLDSAVMMVRDRFSVGFVGGTMFFQDALQKAGIF